MKNPAAIFGRWFTSWRALSHTGAYSLFDATKHLSYALQPQRLTNRELRKWAGEELEIRTLAEGLHEVKLKREGTLFYWLGGLGEGMANGIKQELDPSHPHYYSSPPIQLKPDTLVLDVGACEGLFALYRTSRKEVARVVCFEPCKRTAEFLRRAAEKNGVQNMVSVEVCAVGANSGEVYFSDGSSPEANKIVDKGSAGASVTPQVSIDDYCNTRGIRLKAEDLIKVDAEGADVNVIKGAERSIREGAPQIAVTTYHDPGHAKELLTYLKSIQPKYRFRIKGTTLFNTNFMPRPVLLQASTL